MVPEFSLGLSAATPQEQNEYQIDPGGVADYRTTDSATPPGSGEKPTFSWGVAALNPRLQSAIPSGLKKTKTKLRSY